MRARCRLSPNRAMNLENRNKKAACSQAALCKEAKEEGKSLRKGDARCSPGLRQDTRIVEVSILGRGLKSCLVLRASLFASYISNSETKELISGMWNTGHKLNLFVLLILRGISERNGRPWRSWAGDIEVIRCGTRVPTLDLFMLKLCFRVLLHRF